jgi:hypothetical protein
MSVIEERITGGSVENGWDDEVGDSFCHLYRVNAKKTRCGIPHHLDRNAHSPGGPWFKGYTSCSVCKKPLCLECLLEAS